MESERSSRSWKPVHRAGSPTADATPTGSSRDWRPVPLGCSGQQEASGVRCPPSTGPFPRGTSMTDRTGDRFRPPVCWRLAGGIAGRLCLSLSPWGARGQTPQSSPPPRRRHTNPRQPDMVWGTPRRLRAPGPAPGAQGSVAGGQAWRPAVAGCGDDHAGRAGERSLPGSPRGVLPQRGSRPRPCEHPAQHAAPCRVPAGPARLGSEGQAAGWRGLRPGSGSSRPVLGARGRRPGSRAEGAEVPHGSERSPCGLRVSVSNQVAAPSSGRRGRLRASEGCCLP